MENPLQPLVNRWYGHYNYRGPWFYPKSPYGLGALVPGNMPTRFGPLQPIPDAAQLLAEHGVAPAPAEYFNKSLGQETGRVYDTRPVIRRPLPANLQSDLSVDQRADAGIPLDNQTFMRPMASVFYPRPDASTISLAELEGKTGCWVEDHPILAVAIAGAVFWVLKGGKKR